MPNARLKKVERSESATSHDTVARDVQVQGLPHSISAMENATTQDHVAPVEPKSLYDTARDVTLSAQLHATYLGIPRASLAATKALFRSEVVKVKFDPNDTSISALAFLNTCKDVVLVSPTLRLCDRNFHT